MAAASQFFYGQRANTVESLLQTPLPPAVTTTFFSEPARYASYDGVGRVHPYDNTQELDAHHSRP